MKLYAVKILTNNEKIDISTEIRSSTKMKHVYQP